MTKITHFVLGFVACLILCFSCLPFSEASNSVQKTDSKIVRLNQEENYWDITVRVERYSKGDDSVFAAELAHVGKVAFSQSGDYDFFSVTVTKVLYYPE